MNKRAAYILMIFLLSTTSSMASDGVDIYSSKKSFTYEDISVTCTAKFEAPWDNLYAYESVWNWALFGGYWSWVPYKVGEKYTGEFNYTGMSCDARKVVVDVQTQQVNTTEMGFDVDSLGNITALNPDTSLDVSTQKYKKIYEILHYLMPSKAGNILFDAYSTGVYDAIVTNYYNGVIGGSLVETSIAKLVSDSVFIYLEQQQIKDQINSIMTTQVAPNLESLVEALAKNLKDVERTSNYIISIPAINNFILN